MKAHLKRWTIRSAWLLGIAAVAVFVWLKFGVKDETNALASGNGRIEAVEIDIAAKTPGRIRNILVREGDFVTAGQVVAHMDTDVLEAELRQAEAELRQAESVIGMARSQVLLREAEKAAALAVLTQREAEHEIALKHRSRSSALVREGVVTQQQADDDGALVLGAAAAVSAARAQLAAADAAIATARSQVASVKSATQAGRARIERIRADITDAALRAPRDGRVQYLVAQSGEVVGSGGRVLNMADLSDVFMTFFLPAAAVGRVALGCEARLVLDAAPGSIIPAHVSFVADVAQFTPKTVETAVEREKLMFRVRAHIPPDLLRKHILQVKTGLPGMAYVKLDPAAPWPALLQDGLMR
jgi:HlyD family secretion protein